MATQCGFKVTCICLAIFLTCFQWSSAEYDPENGSFELIKPYPGVPIVVPRDAIVSTYSKGGWWLMSLLNNLSGGQRPQQRQKRGSFIGEDPLNRATDTWTTTTIPASSAPENTATTTFIPTTTPLVTTTATRGPPTTSGAPSTTKSTKYTGKTTPFSAKTTGSSKHTTQNTTGSTTTPSTETTTRHNSASSPSFLFCNVMVGIATVVFTLY